MVQPFACPAKDKPTLIITLISECGRRHKLLEIKVSTVLILPGLAFQQHVGNVTVTETQKDSAINSIILKALRESNLDFKDDRSADALE